MSWRLFWRSLWIQALLNYQRMQGHGYAYMMDRKGPRPFFNTHPWFAAGFSEIVQVESRKERSENEIRLVWMGMFGALGDGLFWAFLRPFAIVLAMLVLVIDASLFWVVPVLFAIATLGVRVYLQVVAAKGEAAVVQMLRSLRLREWMQTGRNWTYRMIAVASGVVWSLLLANDNSRTEMPTLEWLVVVVLSLGFSVFLGLVQRTVPIRWTLVASGLLVAGLVWVIA